MSHGAVRRGARQLWREQGKAQAVQLKLRVAVQCHDADICTAIRSTDGCQLIIVPGIAVALGAKNWSCPQQQWPGMCGGGVMAIVLLLLCCLAYIIIWGYFEI